MNRIFIASMKRVSKLMPNSPMNFNWILHTVALFILLKFNRKRCVCTQKSIWDWKHGIIKLRVIKFLCKRPHFRLSSFFSLSLYYITHSSGLLDGNVFFFFFQTIEFDKRNEHLNRKKKIEEKTIIFIVYWNELMVIADSICCLC